MRYRWKRLGSKPNLPTSRRGLQEVGLPKRWRSRLWLEALETRCLLDAPAKPLGFAQSPLFLAAGR